MDKTVRSSSQCIEEYKKMNTEIMKQNKDLHKRLTEVMGKYKQLNSYNDQLDYQKRKSSKRADTLSELCRKLQVKSKDLSDDLKAAKNYLSSLGITLQFKSDLKSDPKPAPKQQATSNKADNDADGDDESGRDEENDDEFVEQKGTEITNEVEEEKEIDTNDTNESVNNGDDGDDNNGKNGGDADTAEDGNESKEREEDVMTEEVDHVPVVLDGTE